jgi:hypothetical protein
MTPMPDRKKALIAGATGVVGRLRHLLTLYLREEVTGAGLINILVLVLLLQGSGTVPAIAQWDRTVILRANNRQDRTSAGLRVQSVATTLLVVYRQILGQRF